MRETSRTFVRVVRSDEKKEFISNQHLRERKNRIVSKVHCEEINKTEKNIFKMNRNLHSPTKLSDFTRDFDMNFGNKINVYNNSGFNAVNVIPSTGGGGGGGVGGNISTASIINIAGSISTSQQPFTNASIHSTNSSQNQMNANNLNSSVAMQTGGMGVGHILQPQQQTNDTQSMIDQNNVSIGVRAIKSNGKNNNFMTGNGSVSGGGLVTAANGSDKLYMANNKTAAAAAAAAMHQQQTSNQLKLLYEEMIKALPYQNRGTEFISYLLTSSKAANKAQAIALLNAMIDAGNMVQIHASVLNNTMDENSDNDFFGEFNENHVYRLLKMNDGLANSNAFPLNLDVDNNSSYLNRTDPSMLGESRHPSFSFIDRPRPPMESMPVQLAFSFSIFFSRTRGFVTVKQFK